MKKRTNYAAIAVCLGGLGMTLCAIGVILLAIRASVMFAGLGLAVGIALFIAMGVSLGYAARHRRTA